MFELHTAAKLKSVRLDPRDAHAAEAAAAARQRRSAVRRSQPPRFRFLYTGVGLSIAASEFLAAHTPAARLNASRGFASFESSLRRDLRRTGHMFLISRDREDRLALGARGQLLVRRQDQQPRRRARVRTVRDRVAAQRPLLDPRGGVRLIERCRSVDDTRRFCWWPEKGACSARPWPRVTPCGISRRARRSPRPRCSTRVGATCGGSPRTT